MIDAERNDVPPPPLGYHKHEDGGIELYYQPSTGERVRPLAARLSALRAELSAELGRDVLAHVEVRVAAERDELSRMAPNEQLPSYATAVAFSKAHLVVMSAVSPLSLEPPNLEVVLRHALAHIALDEALNWQPVPRWFHEGYAVRFSGADAALRAEMLSVASLRRELLPISSLDAHLPVEPPERSIAWAEAADFLRFLSAPPDRTRFTDMLGKIRGADPCPSGPRCRLPFQAAVESAYGESMSHVELRFRKEMARRYGFVPVLVSATLLWVLVVAAVAIDRLRKRRALAAVPPTRELLPSRRAALAAYPGRRSVVREEVPLGRASAASVEGASAMTAQASQRRARPARVLDEDVVLKDAAPPDPEIPKIEHDGRWYTLH